MKELGDIILTPNYVWIWRLIPPNWEAVFEYRFNHGSHFTSFPSDLFLYLGETGTKGWHKVWIMKAKEKPDFQIGYISPGSIRWFLNYSSEKGPEKMGLKEIP